MYGSVFFLYSHRSVQTLPHSILEHFKSKHKPHAPELPRPHPNPLSPRQPLTYIVSIDLSILDIAYK